MEDPVHVTLNTSASAMSPCVDITGPNRLCACEAVPVLRTGFSKDLPEQLQCSEKGGEIDTRHKSTTRNAVGSKNRSSASGGVTSKDTIMRTTSVRLPLMTEGNEESQQLNPTQIQGTITEDTPVALRTRRGRQQKVPISINEGKGDLFQATHQEPNNDNELMEWFSNLDIYLMASTSWESQPNSLIEAIAIGCPTLVSNVIQLDHRLPPLMRFDPTSKLSFENSLTELLLKSPEEMRMMTACARESLHLSFSSDIACSSWIKLINQSRTKV